MSARRVRIGCALVRGRGINALTDALGASERPDPGTAKARA